jgi:hypothetical protein
MAMNTQYEKVNGSLQNTMKTITLKHSHFSSLQNTMSAITSERSPKPWHHGY